MKQASITFKTSPEVKDALEELAKREFRSLSGQVEMIIVKYLQNQAADSRKEKKLKK